MRLSGSYIPAVFVFLFVTATWHPFGQVNAIGPPLIQVALLGSIGDWLNDKLGASSFWDEVEKIPFAKLRDYSEQLIHDLSTNLTKEAKETVSYAQEAITHIADEAKFLSDMLDLDEKREKITNALQSEVADIVTWTQSEFPPPEEAMGHEERRKMVGKVMGKIEDAVIRAMVNCGVEESQSDDLVHRLGPKLETAITVIGDLAEQHPYLLEALLFTIATAIIPERLIIQPVIRIFGIGPHGPIKGTTATWAQRRFFGASIPKASWFSHLQKAAMKAPSKVPWWQVGASVGAGAGIATTLLGCFGERT